MLGNLTTGIQQVHVADNAFFSMNAEAERPINASIHVNPDSARIAFISSDNFENFTPQARLGFLHIIPHKPTASSAKTQLVPIEEFYPDESLQFRSLIVSAIYNFPFIPQFSRDFQSVTIKMVQTDCVRFEKFMMQILESKSLKNIRIHKTNVTEKVKKRLYETLTKPGLVEIRIANVTCGTEFRMLNKRKAFTGPALTIPARIVREILDKWVDDEYPELKKMEFLCEGEVKFHRELVNKHTGQRAHIEQSALGIVGEPGEHSFVFSVRSG